MLRLTTAEAEKRWQALTHRQRRELIRTAFLKSTQAGIFNMDWRDINSGVRWRLMEKMNEEDNVKASKKT